VLQQTAFVGFQNLLYFVTPTLRNAQTVEIYHKLLLVKYNHILTSLTVLQ